MSLMNRIEISCFLNSRQPEHVHAGIWQPDIVGAVFAVRGRDLIDAVENGCGTASIAEAVLAMLSRDRELMRRTRLRMAPEEYGSFSHVRIEMGVQSSSSRKTVFGIYGNADGFDPLRFYCYSGAIDDCPVTEWLDELRIMLLVPDIRFRNALQELVDNKKARTDPSSEEWQDEISRYFDAEVIRNLVEYRKALDAVDCRRSLRFQPYYEGGTKKRRPQYGRKHMVEV